MKINQLTTKPTQRLGRIKLLPFLALWILLSLSGCLGCGNQPTPESPTPLPKPAAGKAIILLHGFGAIQDGKSVLEPVKDYLQTELPGTTIIAPVRKKAFVGLKEQAQETFKALQEENLVDKELVIFGDSQGGLVAFSLYDQFKDQLKIQGIITNHTPWEGSPVLTPEATDIYAFAAGLSEKIANSTNETVISEKEQLTNLATKLKTDVTGLLFSLFKQAFKGFANSGLAAKDMLPNSVFLQEVAKKLPQVDVPILALAGDQVDFNTHFVTVLNGTGAQNTNLASMTSILKLLDLSSLAGHFSKLLGTDNKDAHDMFIPLYSQTAKSFRGDNTNFSVATYPGYHHFVSKEELIASFPDCHDKMINTIKEYLKLN